MQDITESIDACAAYYGDDAVAVKQYLLDGENRALELPNRGPLKFDDNGDIHSDILEAYSRYGFYILEGALHNDCLLYTSPSPRDMRRSRMPSSA